MNRFPFLDLNTQKVLNEVEDRCTQEQPPACEAACPMHVEVKAMAQCMQKGDFSEAYQLYAKRIPFPGIMGRICDAPCKKVCKREGLGGSIAINSLEQAVTEYGKKPWKAPPFLPKANKSVIIAGGGLRGLTAAYDLLRKGFRVSIFEKEDRLGGRILKRGISQAMVDEELEKLNALKAAIYLNHGLTIDSYEDCAALLEKEKADAIYIGFWTPLFEQGDCKTMTTGNPAVFTGACLPGAAYAGDSIYAMYDGRCAAVSIERRLKAVSLEAGREMEGPFETKLFTDLTGVENKAGQAPGDSFTKEEAVEEAGRCILCECLQCVKGCSFMQYFNSYPKKLVREAYNNLSIVMGNHPANKMINSCNLCGQCGEICPNGLNMKDVFWSARKIMNETGKMPPSYHEFALQDMAYSNSDAFFMVRHQKGFDTSRYLFFPSCQLAASEPALIPPMYQDLCNHLEGGVGLMTGCCSVMAYWSGQEALFWQEMERIRSQWAQMGKPEIITACPTCMKTLGEYGALPVTGIWDRWLHHLEGGNGEAATYAVYDACSSRNNGDVQESIRALAKKTGAAVVERAYSGKQAACCGYGGLTPYVDREIAGSFTSNQLDQPAYPYLTYCINCRDRFLAEGRECKHIGELVYPQVKLNKRMPMISERQENRRHLKESMLKEFWGEETMEEHGFALYISTALEKELDYRRILHSDLKNAIAYGEETGETFIDVNTGHYIVGHKIKNVTFWVDYTAADGGYQVHNAYSHRMSIAGRQ